MTTDLQLVLRLKKMISHQMTDMRRRVVELEELVVRLLAFFQSHYLDVSDDDSDVDENDEVVLVGGSVLHSS
jgi:hypothetical protein